ncbi:hypothetical protein [Microcoleus sp. herbarium2]|uniref:hypothetical protein n=1 Tax=Microcoleus sp. herbarium2 TaxID=3055433 RepID=UPI002FCEE123
MGEAKRRKLAGRIPARVRLECFIARSKISDAHAVYLGIGRGQEVDLRQLDSFLSIVDAWESLSQAKKVLQGFKYHDNQDNDQITRKFISVIHDTFGKLSSDDASCQLSGNTRLGLEWIAQGHDPYRDEPPAGVHIEILKPPVQKKYRVLFIAMKEEPMKSPCGNPEDTHVFSVGKSDAEFLPFIVEDSVMPMYSSYVSAAYMADYLNSRNQDSLSNQEMLRLLYEANQLQGKI